MPTLPVDLNADGVHSIRAPEKFKTTEPFTVELRNHGQPVHVHLNVDDELARVARPAVTNHFLEGDSITTVRFETREPPEPTGGKLKIAVGHGSETTYIDIMVEPEPEEKEEPVDVDDDLKTPTHPDPKSSETDPLEVASEYLPDVTFSPALAFVLLAAAAALLVGLLVRSVIVTAGVVIVLFAAVGAMFVLRSGPRSGTR